MCKNVHKIMKELDSKEKKESRQRKKRNVDLGFFHHHL